MEALADRDHRRTRDLVDLPATARRLASGDDRIDEEQSDE